MKQLDNYRFEERLQKLKEKKTQSLKLKVLYTWVKTGIIGFKDFERLLTILTNH